MLTRMGSFSREERCGLVGSVSELCYQWLYNIFCLDPISSKNTSERRSCRVKVKFARSLLSKQLVSI